MQIAVVTKRDPQGNMSNITKVLPLEDGGAQLITLAGNTYTLSKSVVDAIAELRRVATGKG